MQYQRMANDIENADPSVPDYVRGYAENPRETLTCELKPWIDPTANNYDEVKIAKNSLALRNIGGGVLLIGVSDSGEIMEIPPGYDPDAIFTQD